VAAEPGLVGNNRAEEAEMITMLRSREGLPYLQVEDRPSLSLPRVRLRPLGPGETGPVQAVFDGLSDGSRRMRFLGAVPRLSPRLLQTLADVDQERHGCWVAESDGEPVGIGRYIRTDDDPAVAEIALEVVDRCQGRGLGRLLVEVVGVAAADVGVTSLLWMMDAHNARVRQLAIPLGGRFTRDDDVLEGTTPLPPVPEVDACRITRCARLARRVAARRRAAVA
jgi:GNAT superfamily N-acetyltransferase